MFLEVTLQLPVLLQFRLQGLVVLAGFITLREKTLETSTRFRPELLQFRFGRVGLGIGFRRLSIRLITGLSLCRCLVHGKVGQ